jgi:hypothetical protein
LIPNGPGTGGLAMIGSTVLGTFLSHSAAAGALPTLFAATSPQAIPAGYYGPNGFYEMKGPVAAAKVLPQAHDESVARKLWEVSEQLTGVKWAAERLVVPLGGTIGTISRAREKKG